MEFEGVRSIYQQEDLEAESLTTLAAGASIEDEFDIASVYDMTPGGTYSVRSEGLVHTVTGNKVTGFNGFASNELSIDVDGANVASTVSKDFNPLERRANIARCYGSRGSALKQALENSAVISRQAAQAALTGSAQRFQEYFATTDPSVRQVVSARFQAIAQESSSFTSGATTYYCSDPLGYCRGNVLAYTLPSRNLIANCNIYYSYLPAVAYQCHAQDQATTTLHEFCHAPGVYSPATRDVAYGYQAATSLSTRQALNNADSFALYANGMFLPLGFRFVLTELDVFLGC